MLDQILPLMRCPACEEADLRKLADGIACKSCNAQYPATNGILDMIGSDSREVITPFQRLMQTPIIVSIYENLWRRIGYYLASSRSFDKEMRTVLRLGKGRNTHTALDLACGTGVFTRPLARESSGIFIGLDMSLPMLRQAQRLLEKERAQNIFLIRATAFCMPFVDGAFPYVNCCGALHLFDRPQDALKEIARVLRPGGCFTVQTTIRPNRSAGFAYFLERFIRFGFFNEAELQKLIEHYGFNLINSERHRISFTFLAQRV
jgi:ubiquinone/menaquinone biosynthesis C-methylase UbiE